MRTKLLGAALTLVLSLVTASVGAQSFPTSTVRIVVPFPPGGTSDILARVIAQRLGETWPEPVVVDNKPGAGATIGTNFVAKAAPDGHQLLLTSNAHAIAKSLYRQLPYHPIEDFAPVGLVGTSPNVLVVNPQIKATTVPEFIALAKRSPNQLSFASAGPGAGSHLAGELFNKLANIQLLHVPYKGIGPGIQDVMAGRVSAAFVVLSGVNAQIQAGKLRALAVTSAERSALAPDLPAVQEFGLKGFDVVSWFGIFAPAKTPSAIVNKLNEDIARVLARADVRNQITKLGVEVKGGKPAEFGTFVEADWAVWDKVIKDAGIRVD